MLCALEENFQGPDGHKLLGVCRDVLSSKGPCLLSCFSLLLGPKLLEHLLTCYTLHRLPNKINLICFLKKNI